jgi:glucose/arabinose dehydrogenase
MKSTRIQFLGTLFGVLLCSAFLINPAYSVSPTSSTERAKELFNLGEPIWGVDFLDRDQCLLTTKSGKVYWSNLKDKPTVLKVAIPSLEHGQGGLMDLKVRKEASKTWIYLTATVRGVDPGKQTTALFRAEYKGTATAAGEISKPVEIFRAAPEVDSGYHFGSRIAFDRQGLVYLSLGERNERERAQDLSQHWGKVLRLGADGTIPVDNPWSGTNAKPGVKPEIYTYGHRNPQGIAFDPISEKILVSEHGPRGGDELNVLIPGANYGWPLITYGREYWGPKIGETAKDKLEQPIHHFVPSIAPSSLLIHSGEGRAEWKGTVFQGALKLTHINALDLKRDQDPRKWKSSNERRWFTSLKERIRALSEAPGGTLYFATDSGKFYRVESK